MTLAIMGGAYLMGSIFYRSALDDGRSQLRSEVNGLVAVWVWLSWVAASAVLVATF